MRSFARCWDTVEDGADVARPVGVVDPALTVQKRPQEPELGVGNQDAQRLTARLTCSSLGSSLICVVTQIRVSHRSSHRAVGGRPRSPDTRRPAGRDCPAGDRPGLTSRRPPSFSTWPTATADASLPPLAPASLRPHRSRVCVLLRGRPGQRLRQPRRAVGGSPRRDAGTSSWNASSGVRPRLATMILLACSMVERAASPGRGST